MNSDGKNRKLNVREIALFAMLGALMYASKALMAMLPNIHLIALFIVTFTLVFRVKALYPIYLYVLLEGVFNGFTAWWIPYLYVWTVLWGAVMLLPKRMPRKIAVFVYALIAGLHGILFGTLFAPAQAIFFGLNFKGMIAWIAAGLPFDLIHGISNFCFGFLVLPLTALLKKVNAKTMQ